MASAPAAPWPPAVAGTPPAEVIERAIGGGRLGHSLLLHGDDLDLLAGVAHAIADRLLRPAGTGGTLSADPAAHPDCFALRPVGKLRQITAEATRELIVRLQVTASLAPWKVAIVHEADRMNPAAANIFLKTLEEPPGRTVLILLSTHPYALLPTIRSRCFHFKFSPRAEGAEAEGPARGGPPGWPEWLRDYQAWLGRVAEGASDKPAVADRVLGLYGLIARFAAILERAAAEAWERQKASLPAELEEDQQVALEAGLAAGLRSRLFADIERATLRFARPALERGEGGAGCALPAAIRRLEHDIRLLRLNLADTAALEDFLLRSLRLWSRKQA